MSDFFDNDTENTNFEDNEEESTVFSAPAEHKEAKQKNGNKSRLIRVIAAFVAVAVLVGGTIAVVKLIPEKETEENTSSGAETISVIEQSVEDFASVTVKNSKGNYKLLSSVTKGDDGNDTTVWSVDGIDASFTNSSSVSAVASGAANVTATRIIDTKSESECGFDEPKYTVTVEKKEGEGYSFALGADSPDNTGVYLKVGGSDKIYLVDSSFAQTFDFEPLDFADTTGFAAADFGDGMGSYTDENGTLISFDKITVSGKNFPQTVTIVPSGADKEISSMIAYKVTTPTNRYADNVDSLMSLFSSGLSVSGAYAFDVSESSLKNVGLDSPDMTVSMTVAGVTHTYKFSVCEDGDCAVINDQSRFISKVSKSGVGFVDYNTESFYSGWISIEMLNTLSNFTATIGDTTYSFDIAYDEDDEDEQYKISCNGKKLTAVNFQNFYQFFVGLQSTEYSVGEVSGTPDTKIVMTFKESQNKRTIEFFKSGETKYQYSIDGMPMGKITATNYNKLVKNLKTVSQNKSVKN